MGKVGFQYDTCIFSLFPFFFWGGGGGCNILFLIIKFPRCNYQPLVPRQKHSIVGDGVPFVDPSGRRSSSLNRFLNHLVSRIKFLYLVKRWPHSYFARSSPGQKLSVGAEARDTVLCSWARQFILTVPLSTQVYKWGTGEINSG